MRAMIKKKEKRERERKILYRILCRINVLRKNREASEFRRKMKE